MKLTKLLPIAALIPLVAAADIIVIPPDQPICRLYSLIQVFATIGGVIAAAYAGFILATSNDIAERSAGKRLLEGVILGLIIIWIAPLVVQYLIGTANVCGW